jgi:hypothetical protein
MKFLPLMAVAAAIAIVALTLPLYAAEAEPWPWKVKTPPDPALSELAQVDSVSVTIDKSNPPILSIKVEAKAPSAGFSEIKLTHRIGDPKDRIFAFDARGRKPQKVAAEVLTPATIKATYTDAPIGNFDVIEVYAKDNCKAYSITEDKETACTAKALPQAPLQ